MFSLGRKKRFEKTGAAGGCNTRTIVRDRNPYSLATAMLPIAAAEDMDDHPAVFTHGFHSIHHQVGKDLPQLAGISIHRRIEFVLARKLDARCVAAMLIQLKDTVEHARYLDRYRPLRLPIEAQRLLHDVADALQLLFRDHEISLPDLVEAGMA